MSQACSVSTRKPFGVHRICREWGIARSTFYARRHSRAQRPETASKPGPAPVVDDATVLAAIRRAIEDSPFTGEGYRKVVSRLRAKGVPAGRHRVLRLMREHGLLAPYRATRELGPRVHDGVIVTEAPDVMWATDATTTWLPDEGQVTVFAVVDHFNSECLGLHAARPGTRFEALEPVRQAVRRVLGGFERGIASTLGLALRHDHGSQYVSAAFQREIAFLGIESSPAFVYAPEGNGVVERFFRTLKEQLLWCHHCTTLAELNAALLQWRELYNEHWLVERHGHRSPSQVRRDYEEPAAIAA